MVRLGDVIKVALNGMVGEFHVEHINAGGNHYWGTTGGVFLFEGKKWIITLPYQILESAVLCAKV